jgi:exodeoxyribonuclease V beta subunit
MEVFDVLDRDCDVHQSLLLEASAGTGKTFSIQHLVARLLCERDPLKVNEILLVTFTRAATRELRARVKQNLYQALLDPPGYLVDTVGQKALEEALFAFDESEIYTIHAFCQAMLQSRGFGLTPDQEPAIESIIRDYFRTGVDCSEYAVEQLEIVLRRNGYDEGKLIRKLSQLATQGLPIAESESWHVQKLSMEKAVASLSLDPQHMIEDFICLAPCYKGTCDRQGRIKESLYDAAIRCAEVLSGSRSVDSLLKDGVVLVEALKDQKAKATLPDNLHYPDMASCLSEHLIPLVSSARSYPKILQHLACGCQKRVRRVLDRDEVYGPDDLLRVMECSVEDSTFAASVRGRYKAVIVDEFQDTDPAQWAIIKKLFLSDEWSGKLYLVGDPKQSIYAFRNADVYTYLDAARLLGDSARRVLSTNYRSHPALVRSLNYLFHEETGGRLFSLPRVNTLLDCRPVDWSDSGDWRDFTDKRARVHFFVASGSRGRSKSWPSKDVMTCQLLPFILSEVVALNDQGIPLKDQAVLVRDRYQANDVHRLFRNHGIASVLRRTEPLQDRLAYSGLVELLEAALSPRDLGLVRRALAGPILGWSREDVVSSSDGGTMEDALVLARRLSTRLRQGIGSFLELLPWDRMADDRELFGDLRQLSALLADRQSHTGCSPDQLLAFLKNLKNEVSNEEQQVDQDLSQDGIQILTLHVSKGLEFDVVYALGLVNQTPHERELIQVEQSGQRVLRGDGPSSPERLEDAAEVDAEKLRQLYVALTRAKSRLYVPAAIQTERTPPEPGIASPMELFIAHWQGEPESRLADMSDRGVASWCLCEDLDSQPIVHQKITSFHVNEIPQVSVPGAPIFMHSFTSLAQPVPCGTLVRDVFNEGDCLTPHNLPAGAKVGTLLHRILENFPFENADQLSFVVRETVKGSALEPWCDTITTMVVNTLAAPIEAVGTDFSLSCLSNDCILSEMNFLFSQTDVKYLTGTIDLVFEWGGSIHVVDWKSNWIGSDVEAYHPELLGQVMKDRDYTLQGSIYIEAISRYLERVSSDLIAGQAHYLFLRGVCPTRIGCGVFSFDPERMGAIQ